MYQIEDNRYTYVYIDTKIHIYIYINTESQLLFAMLDGICFLLGSKTPVLD